MRRDLTGAHSCGWRSRWLVIGLVLVLFTGAVDYLTGPYLSLAIFYLVPVFIVAWRANQSSAIAICLFATGVSLAAGYLAEPNPAMLATHFWNATVRLAVLGFVLILVLRMKALNDGLEQTLQARTESLRQESEGRARAEAGVRVSEERMRAIVLAAVDAIITIDQEGRITEFNPAAERMFGYARAAVLGRLMAEAIIPPATATPPVPALLHPSNDPALGERLGLTALRADGTEFPIELVLTPIGLAGPPMFAVFVRDLTKLKSAEKRSAVFADLTRRLSAAGQPDDAARIIMELASELFGWDAGYLHLYSPETDRIVPVLTLDLVNGARTSVPPSSFTLDPSPLMRHVMAHGAQLINQPSNDLRDVPRVAFGDTARRSASLMFVPIRSHDKALGVLSIQSYTPRAYAPADLRLLQALADHCGDALERMRVTEQLHARERALHQVADRASDEERRRIGHELHDGLGQHLTGIAIRAKVLEETLQLQDSPHAAEVGALVKLVNAAISQTRGLAHGLDPIHLGGDDLGSALCQLATELEGLFLVNCEALIQSETLGLPQATSMALYRIAQQAATNAIHHGRAHNLTLELGSDDSMYTLRIKDDGSGFDPDTANSKGSGLKIMQYRAQSIGGSVVIQSHPGQGTEVICRFPRPGPPTSTRNRQVSHASHQP